MSVTVNRSKQHASTADSITEQMRKLGLLNADGSIKVSEPPTSSAANWMASRLGDAVENFSARSAADIATD